jgi:pimeloyl-ACP methyl ester carboxylesterase
LQAVDLEHSQGELTVAPWGATLRFENLGPKDAQHVLVLHSEEGPRTAGPICEELARDVRVLAPVLPGFGGEPRVAGVDRPHHLAYLNLALLDGLGIDRCAIVGTSLGAWVALEMASMDPRRFSSLVLVSPVGVKFAGPLDRTFDEILVDAPARIADRLYQRVSADPWADAGDPAAAVEHAEQREAFLHYVWEPYLHNPDLRQLLGRIRQPALVIQGEQDRLVSPSYFRALTSELIGAEHRVIRAAGHYPDIEQTAETLGLVQQFLLDDRAQPGHGCRRGGRP